MEHTIVSADQFDRYVAQIFARQVLCKKDSTLCLATGDTTKNIFAELVRLKEELQIDFSQVRAINMDEYARVAREDPASCYYRIFHSLYKPLGIAENRFYVPLARLEDAEAECAHFAKVLNDFGGIDLMLLSIGQNGHIAFNEPGTLFNTDIHIASLSESTFKAKAELFGGADKVPRYGLTMGIRTVMHARRIALAAKGAHKRGIMKSVMEGPVTEAIPASVLQLHPNIITVLDEEAAGLSTAPRHE
jgi:glucosamine-6-phosphate deaminase